MSSNVAVKIKRSENLKLHLRIRVAIKTPQHIECDFSPAVGTLNIRMDIAKAQGFFNGALGNAKASKRSSKA